MKYLSPHTPGLNTVLEWENPESDDRKESFLLNFETKLGHRYEGSKGFMGDS